VRNVKTGVSDSGMIAVQGINPGDQVATSSFDKLQAGAKFDIEAGRRSQSDGGQYSVSPSGPFIQRPVATSLLMAAILLVGIVAYTQLPVSALPRSTTPPFRWSRFIQGANPDVMATTVTAPLERQFGQLARPEPDDVDQFRRLVSDRAAVRTEPEYRYCGRRSAVGDQRRAEFSAGQPARAAGL
jgi:hypothetical protein